MLIIVLVVVVMVALAGFGFLADMTTEYEAAKISGDLLQAQQTMASAESFLTAHTERIAAGLTSEQSVAAGFSSTSQMSADGIGGSGFRSRVVAPLQSDRQPRESSFGETGTVDSWRFSVVKRMPAPATTISDILPLESPGDYGVDALSPSLEFGLQNESAKLHLGTLLQRDESIPGSGRTALMQFPGMNEQAADAILDWLDADDEPREFGAEADYYQRLNPPYRPRNDVPLSLQELLFVKGVRRQMFYGSAALPETIDRDEAIAWEDLLTVHSAERNVSGDGLPRLNLNDSTTTDLAAFEAQLAPILTDELARFIRLVRMYGVVYSTSAGVSPLAVDVSPSTATSFFPITDLSDLVDSAVQLPSSSGGVLVNSPLKSDSAEFAEWLRILEDRTSTDSSRVLTGRINIHLASERVLRTLFEDPAIAAQVVQQRATLSESERLSTAWLLTRRVIDVPTYRQIHRDITTRGDVHSAQIVVFRLIGGPILRRKVIIDAANQPARVVDWTDLTGHGLTVPLFELHSPLNEPMSDVESSSFGSRFEGRSP
ncbi:MAG: type II secretion system protein GspK [Planctomycetaceae bacterium]